MRIRKMIKHRTFPKGPPGMPQRPPRPNDKGLQEFPMLPVKMPPQHLVGLKDRARYETTHWRLEHSGRGHVVSPADIVRRLIAEYFANTSPLPDDAVGAIVRSTPD